MESGQRKDKDGNVIPRQIINKFVAKFNGKEVFSVADEQAAVEPIDDAVFEQLRVKRPGAAVEGHGHDFCAIRADVMNGECFAAGRDEPGSGGVGLVDGAAVAPHIRDGNGGIAAQVRQGDVLGARGRVVEAALAEELRRRGADAILKGA